MYLVISFIFDVLIFLFKYSIWVFPPSLQFGLLKYVRLISVKIIIGHDFDNMISTQWPEDDEDIPTYTLEFSDGWQAPEVTAAPEPSEPMRREERQQPAPYQVGYSSRSDIQFNICTESGLGEKKGENIQT